jgi:hypothetical protein
MQKKFTSPRLRVLEKLRNQVTKLINAQRDAERASAALPSTFARKCKHRDRVWKATAAACHKVLVDGFIPASPAGGGPGEGGGP